MTLGRTAAVLRRHSPTEEELTVADVLDAIEAEHRPEPARRCAACGTDWPCPNYVRGEQLAVRALGWAADRHVAHRAPRKETA